MSVLRRKKFGRLDSFHRKKELDIQKDIFDAFILHLSLGFSNSDAYIDVLRILVNDRIHSFIHFFQSVRTYTSVSILRILANVLIHLFSFKSEKTDYSDKRQYFTHFGQCSHSFIQF
jgi:hypothetical protein